MAGQRRQRAEVAVHPYLKADQPSSKDFGGFEKPLTELQAREFPVLPIFSLSIIPIISCASALATPPSPSPPRLQNPDSDVTISDAGAGRDCHHSW